MEDVRKIVGKNISDLRKYKKLTQMELAEALNYSDKAISKWECGDSLPDIEMLVVIANFFGVSLDYLVTEEHETPKEKLIKKPKKYTHNKVMITCLAVIAVWMLATILYTCLDSVGLYSYAWTAFIHALPASFVVLLVFNCIWGKKTLRFIYISLLSWTILLSIYIIFLSYNFWMIFIIGIPVQIAILLWSQIRKK
ncbi:MAG: helix-turn-helix transcriptional regulator [Clostridiales bacterium]|nr:helix-turn-helix transcriptional regulator [Clostridiales bacterium]